MLFLHNTLRLFVVVGRYAIDMTRKLITALRKYKHRRGRHGRGEKGLLSCPSRQCLLLPSPSQSLLSLTPIIFSTDLQDFEKYLDFSSVN